MRLSPFSWLALTALATLASCAAPKAATDATTTTTTTATTARAAPAKAAAAPATATATRATSRFVATPPVIDGKPTDWTDSLTYDANSHLQYKVLHDARMLYVRVRANDAPTQAKLVYLGMVVWLDSTGRNQQQLGVRYPLAIDLNTLKNGPQQPAGAPAPSAAERQEEHLTRLRQTLAQNGDQMELLNFRGSKEPVLTDSQAPLGVKAALGLDARNNLIYELAVPLRLIYRRVPNLAGGRPVVAGVWLAGQKPKLPPGTASDQSDMSVMGSGGNGMGGMGGGMNGGMGGMGGRGMRGSGMRTMQPAFQTFSLKTSALLTGK